MNIINYETIINTLTEKIDRQTGEMLVMKYRIEDLKQQIEAYERKTGNETDNETARY